MQLLKIYQVRLHAILAVAGICASTITAVQGQTLVTDFTAGQPSGQYSFASWTPKSLPEFMKGNTQQNSVNIVGHLFLPPGDEKVPAVLMMHGSGGIYSAMLGYWPDQFNAAGYALLSLDSFGPRGVKSTADDQSLVPPAADTADAFAALRLLASHPRIDAGRIAIMGVSRGGITAWRTAVERVIGSQRLPGRLRFAAHIPVYSGGCVGEFRLIVKPGVFSKAPMLWVHGDADDYTPIGPCQDYADKIAKAGTPVEFTVIPGARHKFDLDDTRRLTDRSAQRTLEGCPVEIDITNFAPYDRFTGERLQGEAYQAVLKKSCRAIGATVEGNRSLRAKAAESILGFLKKVFGS
jgi:dienelactone hydrolase